MTITIRVQNRSIPAHRYLAAINTAKANPTATFKTSLHGWWPATGAEIMAQYRRDLHHRINDQDQRAAPTSRVHPVTWANAGTPRAILYPHEMRSMNRHHRAKLQHRLHDED